MPINTKKPAMKQTVGAQYMCFADATEGKEYDGTYEADVEKTEVVKSVKVTENSETSDVYASGKIYDSDSPMSSIDIEVSVIAFPDDTISKMRGETKGTGGLILAGGKSERPFFAYGKVVKLKNGKMIVLLPPNGYVLEAISEMQAAEETEAVKNIYSVFQQLLNQNKSGFKISRNDILSYDVEEIQDFIANEYMDFVLSIQKDPN